MVLNGGRHRSVKGQPYIRQIQCLQVGVIYGDINVQKVKSVGILGIQRNFLASAYFGKAQCVSLRFPAFLRTVRQFGKGKISRFENGKDQT